MAIQTVKKTDERAIRAELLRDKIVLMAAEQSFTRSEVVAAVNLLFATEILPFLKPPESPDKFMAGWTKATLRNHANIVKN